MKSGVARSSTSGALPRTLVATHATHAAVADAGLMQDDAAPLSYGDLRVRSDRRRGVCLFWVVPDVSPGSSVPDFTRRCCATSASTSNGSAPPSRPAAMPRKITKICVRHATRLSHHRRACAAGAAGRRRGTPRGPRQEEAQPDADERAAAARGGDEDGAGGARRQRDSANVVTAPAAAEEDAVERRRERERCLSGGRRRRHGAEGGEDLGRFREGARPDGGDERVEAGAERGAVRSQPSDGECGAARKCGVGAQPPRAAATAPRATRVPRRRRSSHHSESAIWWAAARVTSPETTRGVAA